MAKQKTHKGVAKRIKVTGTGRVFRRKAGRRHLMSHKRSKTARHLRGLEEIHPCDAEKFKKALVI
jgi:large subunit ribosomal protein L35